MSDQGVYAGLGRTDYIRPGAAQRLIENIGVTFVYDRLANDLRLLRSYRDLERDRGNTTQADAIQRHMDMVFAMMNTIRGEE